MPGERVEVAAFNDLPPDDASDLIRAACANGFWLRVLVAGRPYGSPQEIVAASDGVIGALGWSEVAGMLPAHSLAVDPPEGVDVAALEEYEQRFGFPLAMETTGRTAEQIDAEVRSRIGGDPESEQNTTRRELAAIVGRCLLVTFR